MDDWIAYLEAEPKSEPFLSIAAAWKADKARLAEAERNEGTLLGMIRHQRDVLRECLPYLNESMAGRRPGRSADDIRAAVKALTTDSASVCEACGGTGKAYLLHSRAERPCPMCQPDQPTAFKCGLCKDTGWYETLGIGRMKCGCTPPDKSEDADR